VIWELRRPGNCKALLIDSIERIVNPQRLLPPMMMRTRVGSPFSDVHGQQFESIGRHFRVKLIEDAGLSVAGVIGSSGSYFGLEAIQSMGALVPATYHTAISAFSICPRGRAKQILQPQGQRKP